MSEKKLAIGPRIAVKPFVLGMTLAFVLCGCRSGTNVSNDAAVSTKQKIYSLEDVDKEMKEAGVQLNSTKEELRNFAKAHANYEICQDTDYLFVARMRNSKIDKRSSDQYIVASYDQSGKISSL